MKKTHRLTALLLTVMMLIPLLSVVAYAENEEELVLYEEDLERFSDRVGDVLTLDNCDGVLNVHVPSTATVTEKNGDTFLKVDFVSSHSTEEKVWVVKNGWKLVEEGTNGAFQTDKASYGLMSGEDKNLDKNLIFSNPAVSYETNQTVLLEAQYFLSADAKGTVQSQLHQYRSASTRAKGDGYASWLELFRIDTASGNLLVQNNQKGQLAKNAWSKISILLDLRTGMATYYLNNHLAAKNVALGQTDLEILENTFIVAKIPRTTDTGSNAKNDLAGYFAIDDVRVCLPGKNACYTVPETDAEGADLMYIELITSDSVQEYMGADREFLISGDFMVRPIYFDFNSYKDVVFSKSTVSAKLTDGGGIRFVNTLNSEKFEAIHTLKENGSIADYSFGTLIAPAAFIREAKSIFTVEALDKLQHDVNYIKVEATYGEWYQDQPYTFAGSIESILPTHYGTSFCAVGYVSILHQNGKVEYFYGKYNITEAISMEELAQKTLTNTSDKLNENERNYLKQFSVKPIDTGLGHVKNAKMVQNHFIFEVYESFNDVFATEVSIAYVGNYGWRIKAGKKTETGVESFGAAQALASYMGEEFEETALPLTMEIKDGKIYLYSPDGNYIEIWKELDFMLVFRTADDKRLGSIREIVPNSNGSITLTGGLTVGEGIYGGGERFDTVNKQNTTMDLFTADKWNDSKATYMAIPLFSFSRGMGIYVNRYERIKAQFVDATDQYWKITVEHSVFDGYFFASGDMKDVIKGYTALTGNPELPAEWAHGAMLCRYANDLQTFDKDQVDGNGNLINNRDGAPSGRSVVTLVEEMMRAGMKPSSVIMEAWNYGSISTNPQKLAELKATSEWLDSKGIKAMVYMRVGGSLNYNGMAGFKESYLLHATVTNGSTNTYTTKIPVVGSDGTNPDVSTATRDYLDLTNPEALNWFYDQIWGQLIEIGIDGVKIDFCEEMPDEFYTYGDTRVDYHWYDTSKIVSGTEHHAYPVYLISTFYKRMNELKLAKGYDDGFVVLSRGGGIGSQRNPYLWAGDQVRSFSKLDDQLMAVINSGLSGVPFMTYDMAGYRYGGDGTTYNDPNSLAYESKVFSRAIAFTAFTSAIQTHGTVRNAYELTEEAQEIYRNFTALHEELGDYIRRYVEIACETGIPPVRAMVLEYQSVKNVYSIKDQFILGEGLLVAPILDEESTSRMVFLPKGSWTNLLTGEVIESKGVFVEAKANLGQIPVFLDNDSENAEELNRIFAGEAWQKIQNFVSSETPAE